MIVGRFAPSPSGRMHLGNLFSALLAWCAVRSADGKMILRLEDLDPDRCRPAFCEQVKADLLWLGLDWDEEMPRQSQRTQAYAQVFDRLQQQGLVYPCYCSRGELHAASAPHLADGTWIYPGTCRALTPAQREAKTRRPAWRLMVPDRVYGVQDGLQGRYEENLAARCGDFIIRRSDGVYAYQLAVVTDDIEAGVTQVVRGRDLLSSTPRQLYLYELMGQTPPAYCHVPLLLARDGRRLSKRERDMDLGELRKTLTAPQLVGRLAWLAGLLDKAQAISARELAAAFSWDKVRKEDIIL